MFHPCAILFLFKYQINYIHYLLPQKSNLKKKKKMRKKFFYGNFLKCPIKYFRPKSKENISFWIVTYTLLAQGREGMKKHLHKCRHCVIYLGGEERICITLWWAIQSTGRKCIHAYCSVKELLLFRDPQVEKQIWNSYHKHQLSNIEFL